VSRRGARVVCATGNGHGNGEAAGAGGDKSEPGDELAKLAAVSSFRAQMAKQWEKEEQARIDQKLEEARNGALWSPPPTARQPSGVGLLLSTLLMQVGTAVWTAYTRWLLHFALSVPERAICGVRERLRVGVVALPSAPLLKCCVHDAEVSCVWSRHAHHAAHLCA
jgi:hypothetical protein